VSEGQWIGVLLIAVGVYLLVCSIWARGFLLYRLKTRRAAKVFGETVAHRFYTVLGVILTVAGIARVAGVL
jgi:hypothetical protein